MKQFSPVDNQESKRPASASSSSSAPLLSKERKGSYDTIGLESSASDSGVQQSVFDDPVLAHFYQPHYLYEGLHRFDPRADWTKAEEEKVVSKIDKWIMSWCCVMFIALQLDRGNIKQAMTDNFLEDLGMNTNDYNIGQAIFYSSFLIAELPSQMLSKRFGPHRWIPVQMILWSAVAAAQCGLTGRVSFFITRGLVGMIEGGFIPTAILYLSYFYTSKELPVRLSWFWTGTALTGIFASFLACGILSLRGAYGWEGWRYLFIIEGTATGIVGIISWFYMPPSPTQTKSRFRGEDGWFTPREEVIMVNRILRDDPTKGDMHNRQAIGARGFLKSLMDYDMWPLYVVGVMAYIPMNPPMSYLTLTLRDLGFDVLQSNLLTIPSTILLIFMLLKITKLSGRYSEKTFIASFGVLWTLPLLVILRFLPSHANPWYKYLITTLICGHPYPHAILGAWVSSNSGSVRTRSVSAAIYNMAVQSSSIFASTIYREDDRPDYRRGNTALICIALFDIALFVGVKKYYVWRNEQKERVWGRMNTTEKANYLATTEDEGNKRLDFRFMH